MDTCNNHPAQWLAILWVAGWIVGGLVVIFLAYVRCPKCRGWHVDEEENKQCKEQDENTQ